MRIERTINIGRAGLEIVTVIFMASLRQDEEHLRPSDKNIPLHSAFLLLRGIRLCRMGEREESGAKNTEGGGGLNRGVWRT